MLGNRVYLVFWVFLAGFAGFFSSGKVIGAPAKPTLASPSNGAVVNGSSVTLSWYAVSGAGAYSVGLRDQNTGVLANIPLVTGTSYTANVTTGHAYVWDVASCSTYSGGDNTSNCPNRTSNWSFSVQSAVSRPGSFTLSGNPYCNTSSPTAPAVMLTWSASSGATSYEVYRNGGLYASGITGTSFDNNLNVTAGQTYSYSVVANNSGGTTWNANGTISVTVPANVCGTSPTVPGSFTLSGNAYCNTSSPTAPAVMLTWSGSSGATSYDLYRNGGLYASGITGTSFDNNLNVSAGETYTYSVVANNSGGTTWNANGTISVTVPANVCGTSSVLTPILNTVSPTSYPASGGNQIMRLIGSNFESGDTLTFYPPGGGSIESKAQKLAFGSNTQLVYQFNNANDAGVWGVQVNSPDGAQHSNRVSFNVETAVTQLPNLVPQDIALDKSTVSGGDTLTVTWKLANTGSGSSPATVTGVRINQTISRTSVSDGTLANIPAPVLAPFSSVQQSATITIPNLAAGGTYYVWVVADNAINSTLKQSNYRDDYAVSVGLTGYPAAANSSPMLTVNITGEGTVAGGGISCVSSGSKRNRLSCSKTFKKNSQVTLGAPFLEGLRVQWGDGCLVDGVHHSCTVTMDKSKTVEVAFKSSTPLQDDPEPRYGTDPIQAEDHYPKTLDVNAVVITHGWNSDVDAWAYDMAKAICNSPHVSTGSPYNDFYHPGANKPGKVCFGNRWEVWVVDWRDAANTTHYKAYVNAQSRGSLLAASLYEREYKHVHLIAHSAGSMLIETAASELKRLSGSSVRVHETFLDAFEPTIDAASGSIVDSIYGRSADWAEHYVDTRPLQDSLANDNGVVPDGTAYYLKHAYNIDVNPTYWYDPEDGCSSLYSFWNPSTWLDPIVCRHSRPYRFYGYSLDSAYLQDSADNGVDPIGSLAGKGYSLSEEGNGTLGKQASELIGKACQIVGDNCIEVNAAQSEEPKYSPILTKAYEAATQVGNALCEVNVISGLCNTLGLTTRTSTTKANARAAAAARSQQGQIEDTPTQDPAWFAVAVETAESANTLRFSYRFRVGGEGLLRVFIDDEVVRELDQRYVPMGSLQSETVFIGDLPAGIHRIAFRLDGYGESIGNVELTGIELGRQAISR